MTRPLTTPDTHALINACSPRDALMVRLMASTGLRVSEAVALNVGQIRKATDGLVHLHDFKGAGSVRGYDKSRQEVIVHSALLADLLAHVADRADGAPLFLNTKGNRLTRKGVQYVLKTAAKRAGIGHVHPHMLRHFFATSLDENGETGPTVQAMMRHASFNTTARYIHPRTTVRQNAANAVGV